MLARNTYKEATVHQTGNPAARRSSDTPQLKQGGETLRRESLPMGCAVGKANPKCFLEIAVDGKSIGRLIVEVRNDVVPITAENFCSLCSGQHGSSYKGTTINRIVPGFIAQGGECGKSIYGKKFDDENFKLLHKGKGILSMANNGPHTNGSQFFLSLGECSQLDGKHVVFGKVINGKEVLDALNEFGTTEGKTKRTVTITDCGVLTK